MHIIAGERLKDRLERSARVAGCAIHVTDETSKPWSAALFMGGLHEMTLFVRGEAGQDWLDCLDEYSVCLPGFVLSKLEVSTVETVGGELTATIEAETVKEA